MKQEHYVEAAKTLLELSTSVDDISTREELEKVDVVFKGLVDSIGTGVIKIVPGWYIPGIDSIRVEGKDLLEITVGPVGLAPTVYVNFAHPGTERGTQAEPFNSVLEAAAFVSSGGTVSIAAGSSGETIIIGKAMTLVRGGASGTAVIGAP